MIPLQLDDLGMKNLTILCLIHLKVCLCLQFWVIDVIFVAGLENPGSGPHLLGHPYGHIFHMLIIHLIMFMGFGCCLSSEGN